MTATKRSNRDWYELDVTFTFETYIMIEMVELEFEMI